MSSELGSWVGLYHWVVEKLMLDRMTAERDVLTVLAMRANPLGFCWPGVGYIAQLIGRADSTVENALARLELMGFITVIRTQNNVRNRVDVDYQVRPDVMFIAPDRFDEASKLWQQNCNVNITIVMKESQPTTGIRIKNQTTGNQHQNQQQQQTAFRETERPAPPVDNPKNAGSENTKNSGSAAIPPAATPQSPNPSPVPPSPSPLVSYDMALPDEVAEQIAARMNAETRYMMAVATARGLVVKYGPAACEAALAHMARQTGIRKPAAYLRSTIERAGVDPVQDAKIVVDEADAKTFVDYVGGKYASYINNGLGKNDLESRDE